MKLWQILIKLGGIKALDNYLKNNKSYLNKLDFYEARKLLHSYLSYDFDEAKPYPFAILDYIMERPVLTIDGELTNSKYFKTMPGRYVGEILDYKKQIFVRYDLPKFQSMLIAKITKIEELNFLEEGGVCFRIPELVDKILSFKDIDFAMDMEDALTERDWNYLKSALSKYFSVEEIKEFSLKWFFRKFKC